MPGIKLLRDVVVKNFYKNFSPKTRREKGGCLRWLAFIDPITGYGQIGGAISRVLRTRLCHKVVLQLKLGRPLLKGYESCHTCNNRWCVEKVHLYEGTHKQNMRQASKQGRMRRKQGVDNPSSVLSSNDVKSIRHSLKSAKYWAAKLSVCAMTIYNVRSRKSYRFID